MPGPAGWKRSARPVGGAGRALTGLRSSETIHNWTEGTSDRELRSFQNVIIIISLVLQLPRGICNVRDLSNFQIIKLTRGSKYFQPLLSTVRSINRGKGTNCFHLFIKFTLLPKSVRMGGICYYLKRFPASLSEQVKCKRLLLLQVKQSTSSIAAIKTRDQKALRPCLIVEDAFVHVFFAFRIKHYLIAITTNENVNV